MAVLEDESSHQVNEIGGDRVRVPDEVQSKLYHFLFEVAFQGDNNVLG